MSRYLLVLCFLTQAYFVFGQQDSINSLKTIGLKEVVVSQNKLKASEIGLTNHSIDSMTLVYGKGTSLSEILKSSGLGQLRSYGPLGLSTPSFRGSGSSHTAVLWNGINIQSPLSGQQDLSQVPSSIADNIQIQKGGSASLYGSGAIGGTIQLNSDTRFNQGLKATGIQKIGSFGLHYQDYELHFSNNKISTTTSFFDRKLKNDYPYTNHYVRPARTETRQHAELDQLGFLQEADIRINDSQLLGIRFWYQKNNYQIPNSILATQNSEAVQKDEYTRTMLEWNLDKRLFSLTYKQAFLWHQLQYDNQSLSSQSAYKSWVNRLEGEFDLSKNATFVSGINHTLELSNVDNFDQSNPQRHNTAFFSSIRFSDNDQKFLLALNVREEIVNATLTPFSPSLGLSYSLSSSVKVKGNISRNYKIPTFNDLYWKGESKGNPNLRPETSWNEELGLSYEGQNKDLSISATVFNGIVNDWIQWAPTSENSNQWTPKNLKQVWMRGAETSLSGTSNAGDLKINWNLGYSYTKSTNRKVAQGDNGLHKQLFYTPNHEGNFSTKLSHSNISLWLLYSYTGRQFTDENNTEIRSLSDYQIIDTYLSKNFDFGRLYGNLEFKINNVFDIDYENRRGYPMHGRNFSLGINLTFKQIKRT